MQSEVCEAEKMRHLQGDWLIYYSAKFHPFRSIRSSWAPIPFLGHRPHLSSSTTTVSTPRGASTFFNIIISSSTSTSAYLVACLPGQAHPPTSHQGPLKRTASFVILFFTTIIIRLCCCCCWLGGYLHHHPSSPLPPQPSIILPGDSVALLSSCT